MERIPKRPHAFFRVGPAGPAEPSSFAIRRGDIDGRIDVNYWWVTPLVNRRLMNAKFDIVPLGSLLTLVQYGCSSLSKEDGPGVPILRMNNLQENGWDFESLKYVELSKREFETYRLVSGDILINRTNSKELVGKCAVFQEPDDWVFASYLVRVRADDSRLIPQFAVDFLGSDTGRLQINQLSRQIIGMTNINTKEIRQLRIPLPSISEQGILVSTMDGARAHRQAKLTEADALLLGLDEFVLGLLGVNSSLNDHRTVFAVRQGRSRLEGRLNPDYYHPERIAALSWLSGTSNELTVASLASVVGFVRKQVTTPGANYVGLASVQSHTGEIVELEETASGNCFVYQPDDVLFARLRPYLNKVHRAEVEGCCSTEFHVLRVNQPQELMPEYLAVLLRSRLVLAQTVHMTSGNTHPRLTNEDVANLPIPIPSMELQKTIVAEVACRRNEARLLREEASAIWQSAKNWFEEQLLGEISA